MQLTTMMMMMTMTVRAPRAQLAFRRAARRALAGSKQNQRELTPLSTLNQNNENDMLLVVGVVGVGVGVGVGVVATTDGTQDERNCSHYSTQKKTKRTNEMRTGLTRNASRGDGARSARLTGNTATKSSRVAVCQRRASMAASR